METTGISKMTEQIVDTISNIHDIAVEKGEVNLEECFNEAAERTKEHYNLTSAQTVTDKFTRYLGFTGEGAKDKAIELIAESFNYTDHEFDPLYKVLMKRQNANDDMEELRKAYLAAWE